MKKIIMHKSKEDVTKFRTYSVFLTPIIITIVLLIGGQIINPGFADLLNIGNLLATAGILTLGAAGQTLVIISGAGGIDMSMGAMMSMGAVLGSGLLNGSDGNFIFAVVVLILLGALFGFINGAGVHFMKIPPLVMTLAMASVVDGFTIFIGKGRPWGKPSPLLLTLGGGRIFIFIRFLVLISIAFIIFFTLVLNRTRYGRKLYLVGNNRSAAVMNGISVGRTVIFTYIIAGIMYSIAGLFLLSAVGTAQMQMGAQYTMLSIAAVVLGGTKLSGGEGTYVGSALGAMVLMTLTSVLITIGMAQGVRLIITGLVLLSILGFYSRQPKLRQ